MSTFVMISYLVGAVITFWCVGRRRWRHTIRRDSVDLLSTLFVAACAAVVWPASAVYVLATTRSMRRRVKRIDWRRAGDILFHTPRRRTRHLRVQAAPLPRQIPTPRPPGAPAPAAHAVAPAVPAAPVKLVPPDKKSKPVKLVPRSPSPAAGDAGRQVG